MFFGFGSLSNKQDTDQPRYESRITKIKMEMYPVYSCHSINERSPTLVLEKTPSWVICAKQKAQLFWLTEEMQR